MSDAHLLEEEGLLTTIIQPHSVLIRVADVYPAPRVKADHLPTASSFDLRHLDAHAYRHIELLLVSVCPALLMFMRVRLGREQSPQRTGSLALLAQLGR